MAAPSVTTLLNNGGCFNCVTPGIWNLIRLAYLARIVAGDTSVADISTLLAESGCFACLTAGEQMIAELGLLKNLQESGAGTGGTAQIKSYVADPNVEGVVPGDQSQSAIAYAAGGVGNLYTWNTTTHIWQ
jgi:hypothetical protein